MKIQHDPPVHLTYCLNVHPGETWVENLAAIRDKAVKVRDRVAGGRPFGLGLRLGRQAADELADPAAMGEFREFLAAEDLYVFTINGFPYGQFHGTRVKEDVYRPDWRTEARREYTVRLGEILAGLLPEGVSGSISTVPGSYRAWIQSPEDVRAMAENLADVAAHLARLRETTGRAISLALEPEPDCWVENTDEAVAFLTGPLARLGGDHLRGTQGLGIDQADRALREHLGVCFDTAHAAVQFEDLAESLAKLERAGVKVSKIQLSSALQVRPTAEALSRLRDFCDEVYLHQVKVRGADGSIASYADLPAALAAALTPASAAPPDAEWRVHFHVPLFLAGGGELGSTAGLLTEAFRERLVAGVTEHLEIETYTFDVLPPALRAADVAESVAREVRWVMDTLWR